MNQYQNTWAKTPGMHERAVALRRAGSRNREIARTLSAEFGIHVGVTNVENHLRRSGDPVDAGKGAMVPRELIEPKAGYARPALPPVVKHPQGWEPRVEENGDEATAVSQPTDEANPDEESLIRSWNFDPKEWMITGPINCRRWQGVIPVESEAACKCLPKMPEPHYEHPWQFYYKASLIRRAKAQRALDIKELLPSILSMKPSKTPAPGGDSALGLIFADLQMGKDDVDGVTGTVARAIDKIEMAKDQARHLRRAGVSLGALYVFGLGDLVEGCDGWYDQQAFRVQLNRRDQVKVARRIVIRALRELAPLFPRVVVAAIPGNHGEHRKDGKSFTTFGDNDDVAIFEMAEETLSENPDAFSHVSFVIPKDDLTVTLDVCGTITGLAHGHQAGRGNGAASKMQNWWKDQAHGQQPIGSAQLLLSGHWHHLIVNQSGSKTHIQAPALEGGSDWWREQTGQEAPKGLMTVAIGKTLGPVINGDQRAGWDHLRVL